MTVPALVILHPSIAVSASVSVVASALTGFDIAQGVGAIVGAIVAVIGLGYAVSAANAKKKTAYAAELRTEWKAGHDSRDDEVSALTAAVTKLNSDMEFYRAQYAGLLQLRAGAPAVQLPPAGPTIAETPGGAT